MKEYRRTSDETGYHEDIDQAIDQLEMAQSPFLDASGLDPAGEGREGEFSDEADDAGLVAEAVYHEREGTGLYTPLDERFVYPQEESGMYLHKAA